LQQRPLTLNVDDHILHPLEYPRAGLIGEAVAHSRSNTSKDKIACFGVTSENRQTQYPFARVSSGDTSKFSLVRSLSSTSLSNRHDRSGSALSASVKTLASTADIISTHTAMLLRLLADHEPLAAVQTKSPLHPASLLHPEPDGARLPLSSLRFTSVLPPPGRHRRYTSLALTICRQIS